MIDKYKIQSLDVNNKAYSIADYDYFMQVANKNPVYYIPQTLTLYRRHETNLSGTNPKIMEEVSNLIKRYRTKHIISDKTYHIKISHNNLMQSIIYMENGNKKKSFHKRKEALHYNKYDNSITKFAILGLLCLP